MKHMTTRSSYSQTNVYNGLDTRVSKTVGALTRTYHRAGPMPTDPVLSDGANFYTPGISVSDGTSTRFQHGGLKSFDAQSDAGEAIQAERQYDAFGNLLSVSGTRLGELGYGGAFGYQEDEGSGLRLLGHRYYDSSTGRFLTRDPIKDGRNWYVYCENDPVNNFDSDGHKPRPLTQQERERVRELIKLIETSGFPDAAKTLDKLLQAGKILHDPNETGATAYVQSGQLVLGSAFFDDQTIYAASTLFHEVVHIWQGTTAGYSSHSERYAYGAQIHFLEEVRKQRKGPKDRIDIDDWIEALKGQYRDVIWHWPHLPLVIRRPNPNNVGAFPDWYR